MLLDLICLNDTHLVYDGYDCNRSEPLPGLFKCFLSITMPIYLINNRARGVYAFIQVENHPVRQDVPEQLGQSLLLLTFYLS